MLGRNSLKVRPFLRSPNLLSGANKIIFLGWHFEAPALLSAPAVPLPLFACNPFLLLPCQGLRTPVYFFQIFFFFFLNKKKIWVKDLNCCLWIRYIAFKLRLRLVLPFLVHIYVLDKWSYQIRNHWINCDRSYRSSVKITDTVWIKLGNRDFFYLSNVNGTKTM